MRIAPKSRKEIEVWKACDQLASEGLQITYQAVGERLLKLGYRRGSNSDIHRYLSTWRSMEHRTSEIPLLPLQSHLDPLSGAIEQFKKEIWDSARKEVEKLKLELQEKTTLLIQAEARILELDKQESSGPLVEALQALSKSRDLELLKLYDHHQTQFDHYLKAICAVKEENSRLNAMLKQMRKQMALF